MPYADLFAVLFALVAAVFAGLFLSYRRRLYDAIGRGRGDPIPTVELSAFHPRFEGDELGPTTAAEVAFIGTGDGVPHGTSDREAWILAVLAKDAKVLFEFGTATGRTTYLWARNAPADAVVATLTLGPDDLAAYRSEAGDAARGEERALEESTFTRFRYDGTGVAGKVRQLYGDSKTFDEGEWVGRCDLVFIDGSHTYSYVANDTEKALRMVAPGGVVLWHDYRSRWAASRDVYRYLNERAGELGLVRLAGTSLVGWRR